MDDSCVLCDVLALHDAVAACDGAHEHTVLVAQRHGEAVNLLLDDELRVVELLLQFLDEGEDLFFAEDILQGEHRHVVTDEQTGGAARLAADHLRRRVLGDELWVLLLDCLEAEHQLIVLVVGDGGIIFIVVAVVVVADCLAELGELFLDGPDILDSQDILEVFCPQAAEALRRFLFFCHSYPSLSCPMSS